MPTPRLWSWRLSPFAGKARVAFAEKGVDVELLEIDPRKRPARLRDLNPTNRIPVLEVGDVAIRESSAICDWVEDTHDGPALWPADPALRAAGRGLQRLVDDELNINFFLAMRKEVFGLDETDPPDIVETLRRRLTKRWATFEDLLGRTDGTWLLGGAEPSLADFSAMPLAVRLPEWKPELAPDADAHPRVDAWLDALRGRPTAEEVDRSGASVE